MNGTRRMRRVVATVAVGAGVLGGASALAVAGPGVTAVGSQPTTTTTPGAPSMEMTGTMEPGGSVSVEAQGFEPGSTVTITMDGSATPVASGVANALGRATIRLTIPADMAAGPHTMVLAGQAFGGEIMRLTSSMTIGAAAGAAVSPATPTAMDPAFTG